MTDQPPLDVLIVGAGPTGLALATQLEAFGVRFRIVDRSLDRAHESRAAAVQARTIEMLQPFGLADALVARGNASATLELHFDGGRSAELRLSDFGAEDTRFPFILFVSQAETEALLGEHLAARGVAIERGLELTHFDADAEGVDVVLCDGAGVDRTVRTRFLIGCDGAHSTVRRLAGIQFEGDAYEQHFMLGDVEAEATPGAPTLKRDTVHSFPGRYGMAMMFPLGKPASWRVIAMSTRAGARPVTVVAGDESSPMTTTLTLAELQRTVDDATGGAVRVHDPVWLSHFRLHHRQASHYRAGRVFLVGDAAHIHSPVGAQGMNTGMQDAWNLGWKLALVARGAARPTLLDTYEAERWPVGHALLRYTDRIFGVFTRAMSSNAFAAWVRRAVVPRVVPTVLGAEWLRTYAFRFVSELGIAYSKSEAVVEGTPALESGPRAGARLPDAEVVRDGRATTLQREVVGTRFCLLVCDRAGGARRASVSGASSVLNATNATNASNTSNTSNASNATNDALEQLLARYGTLLTVRRLVRSPAESDADALVDEHGVALDRLGVRALGIYLVRPDGYVAYRCAGTELGGVERWLERWMT